MFVTRDYHGISDPCMYCLLFSDCLAQLSAEQHLQLPVVPYFNPHIESRSRNLMGEFEACLSDPW